MGSTCWRFPVAGGCSGGGLLLVLVAV